MIAMLGSLIAISSVCSLSPVGPIRQNLFVSAPVTPFDTNLAVADLLVFQAHNNLFGSLCWNIDKSEPAVNGDCPDFLARQACMIMDGINDAARQDSVFRSDIDEKPGHAVFNLFVAFDAVHE